MTNITFPPAPSDKAALEEGAVTLTSTFTGVFKDSAEEQARFFTLLRAGARA